MSSRHEFGLRRVYDAGELDHQCHRVLVDRLWPRGLAKHDATWDEWLKDVAPSTELRRWYGHEVSRFEEFSRRYRSELRRPPASDAVDHLIDRVRVEQVTLLTATRDVAHSGAHVLHRFVTSRADRLGDRRRASTSREAVAE